MTGIAKKIAAIFLLVHGMWFNASSVTLGQSSYSLSNTVQGRTTGMAGAMTAVQDGLGNAIFNPASMEFYRYPQSFQMTCFLNPVGGIAAIKDRDRLSVQKEYDRIDWINLAGIFIKGVTLTSHSFSVGLLLSEQLLMPEPPEGKNDILSSENLLDYNYNALAARLELAKQVSIGASSMLFNVLNGREMQRLFGISYGVYLQPNNKISVGVVYFDIPHKMRSLYLAQNHIVDETINVGISYRPFSFLMLAADVRNVTEEEQSVTRELHAGMELMPFQFVAIRSGYYKCQSTRNDLYSVGIGLLNSASFRSAEGQFVYPDFMINYGFQVENSLSVLNFTHVLTVLLRL